MSPVPPTGQVTVPDDLPPHPPSFPVAGPPDPPPPPPPPAGERGRPGWLAPVGALAVVAAVAAGFGVGWVVKGEDDGGSAPPAAAPSVAVEADTEDRPTQPPLESSGEEPVAAVADVVAPTVVQIETATGLGSGVVYDPDGLVLTAAHVIEGSTSVTLRLADGTTREGTVVGSDADSDIGVVAMAGGGDGLPVAVLADEVPDVGDLAVAVGSPFGLDQTVTSGIVSALDRPAPAGGPAVGTLQIDTPINSGNSGGPIANRDGEVIGIASYIQTQTGGNIGLGFAIPVDIAVHVADALVAGAPVEFGYLGVEGGDAAGSDPGALLAAVVPGSPAEDAGLQAGDLVVAADGQTVTSFGELGVVIRSLAPGAELELTVSRDGDQQDLTATLGSTAD